MKLDKNEEFKRIITNNLPPKLSDIVELAHNLNIKDVTPFWDLVEKVHTEWREFKSAESLADWL